MVEADDLSVPAILDGIRNGRVFIDLTASHDRVIDLDARLASSASEHATRMGGAISAPASAVIHFRAHVAKCSGSVVHLFLDGREIPSLPALTSSGDESELPFSWTADGRKHWIIAEVRDAQDRLQLISNPIYILPGNN